MPIFEVDVLNKTVGPPYNQNGRKSMRPFWC